MEKNRRRTLKKRTKHSRRQVKRIDVLSDDVLLEIFDFCCYTSPAYPRDKRDIVAWQTLVHVCRRWRNVVFESPRRLNLRLCCTAIEPTKDPLEIWPDLPLVVQSPLYPRRKDVMNIAALRQSNRVCEVDLTLKDGILEEFLAVMQVPFPELTVMALLSNCKTHPVIPDSFLGGSAPRLECFVLTGILFPGMPKLLLSATHLLHLGLHDIPDSGYISPEAIVASLSVLPRLETLILGFRSCQARPDFESRSLYPPDRSILPTLKYFAFQGVSEYFEDLVGRIDTPQLDDLHVKLLNQIDLLCTRIAQFINRIPKHGKCDNAHVQLHIWSTSVVIGTLAISIPCGPPDRGLSSVIQLCSSSIPSVVEAVENLYIEPQFQIFRDDYEIENIIWLQLLLPFTAVKNLYLSEDFAPGVASALQELVGDEITDILPSLQNIFVEELGPFEEEFEEEFGLYFVARRLSGSPVTISDWDKTPQDDSLWLNSTRPFLTSTNVHWYFH